jgi:UrcA family protein
MAKLSIILLAVPIALTSFTVPAVAADSGNRPTAIVRYDDLNLKSPEGRERLNTRVRFAVRSVCGSSPLYRQPLRERESTLHCVRTTLRDADVKLAALFDGDGTRLADRGGRIYVSAP